MPATSRKPIPAVIQTIAIHPDLKRDLKRAAVDSDQTVVETLHKLLCKGLNRSDLLDQVPTTSRAAS